MVVSAPTGCGKTVLFELAILRTLQDGLNNPTARKRIVVYVAPLKALCQQIQETWSSRFGSIGLHVIELTGDTEMPNYATLMNSDIILTTPEKFDSITRKWKDNMAFMSQVSLVLKQITAGNVSGIN